MNDMSITYKIFELYKKGVDTFQTEEKFKIWLDTHLLCFGVTCPSANELLDIDINNADLIIDTLHRIDHGILS